MNAEVYIFGDLGDGYTQYVDDCTRTLFKSIVSMSKANSQLVIRREETLMYYIYVRRLRSAESSNMYIGISYAINNSFVRDIDGLFSIFEGAITTIVARGVILEFTDDGGVTSSLGKIHKAKSEFAQISAYLKAEIDSFMAGKNDALPLLDYSINTSESKTFRYTDSKDDIIAALATFPNIIITKDADYNNSEFKNYASTLFRMNKENLKLKTENAKVLREKKRTTIVTVLSLILAVGIIIIIGIANRASEQEKQIKRLKYDKEQLTEHVGDLQKDSIYFVRELDKSQKLLQSREKHIKRLQNDSIIIGKTNNNLRADLDAANNKIKTHLQTIDKKDSELKEKDRIISGLRGQVNTSGTSSQSVSNTILISAVKIASVKKNGWQTNNDFGKSISSYNSYYLKVMVEYRCGVKDKYMSIKLFGPAKKGYGSDLYSLITEKVPPVTKGSSFAQYMFNNKLGNHDQQLPAGSYRIEFWYYGEIIKEHSFMIN